MYRMTYVPIMASKARTAAVKNPRDVFAGELDYASVTDFREKLLPVVNDLEANPTKRYLVTKHGKPLAVFLSFDAFEAIRKVVEAMLDEEEKKPPSQVLVEAVQRMDRPDAGSAMSIDADDPVALQLKALEKHVLRIESLLTTRAKTAGVAKETTRG